MAGTLQKNDFVELDFTGRVKNGDIFDTNIKEEAKKIELDIETRPMIICLGQNMILQAIDEFLIEKETGKEYTIELPPEKAFGNRTSSLVKTMPLSVFTKQKISPQSGMVFAFDDSLGKVTAVSGGRIIVDFNNPIAGKEVVYILFPKRKLSDENEKIKTLMLYFFRKEFSFKIENKKLIIEIEKKFSQFIQMFAPRFKEMLGLDLEVKEIEEKKQEVKEKPEN